MRQIPMNLQNLFWDIKIETFDPHEYPEYTISRVLEFGDKDAVAWIKEVFYESEITGVIRANRNLSSKSANFWAIMFNIPLCEIAALNDNGSSYL